MGNCCKGLCAETECGGASSKTSEIPLSSNVRSLKTAQCNVQCYGRGDVHGKIVEKLKITHGEGPDFPCILFVYKVSRETEDLRNALQWVTEKQGVRREDICAVVLLEKSLDKRNKQVDVAHQGMFDDKTVVVRILWKQQNSSAKLRKGPKGNREAINKVKQSIEKCRALCTQL